MTERIKVFQALNHLGHQYEQLKLAKRGKVKFYYLENNVRRWSRYAHRPEPTTWLTPDEFEWVQYYEPGKYDLAILGTDQQHVDPMIGKGQLFRQLNEVIQDIPKIVVNHGTPMWSEQYDEERVKFGGDVITTKGVRKLDGMKDLVKDCALMIVNSYASVDRWEGVHDHIYPLIHGLDPKEYLDLPKEPRVVMSLSPGGLDKYYNRSLITAIKSAVMEKTGLEIIHTNVNYDVKDWQDYKELLGSSLISIYPFRDSPMPRSRTESLLSGSCVLSSRYHNADEFISHGVNGFIVPDNPLSYAEAIHLLINEGYADAVQVGQRGKEMAQKYFQLDRYLDQFEDILFEVAHGRIPKWDGSKVWDDKP